MVAVSITADRSRLPWDNKMLHTHGNGVSNPGLLGKEQSYPVTQLQKESEDFFVTEDESGNWFESSCDGKS